MVTRAIEAALSDDDEIAGERRDARQRGQTFQALVVGEGLEVRRHRNHLAARCKAVAAKVEPHDLLDALDADVMHAVELRERLDVVPFARGQGLAVSAEYRRHFSVRNTRWLAVLIENAAAQPRAIVGDGKKAGAVGFDVERGDAAEGGVSRREHEAAAEFQR